MSAREEILARIRAALAGGGPPGPGPDAGDSRPGPGTSYRTRSDPEPGPRLDLLAERLADYRALVRRASPAGLGTAVSAALVDHGARRVLVPTGLDLGHAALPGGIEIVTDNDLSAAELDAFDGVITGAAVAIAETGTIVLDGSPGQGRRAITLVPDYHLCIVSADQVVEIVPEAVARLAERADRPLTWISGPSATSDIELKRVEGVHGPRTLEVILVGP